MRSFLAQRPNLPPQQSSENQVEIGGQFRLAFPAPGLNAFSDSELIAALATARGQDGAAGAGTHPPTEAMDLGPPTVIRLERALAHWNSRYGSGNSSD